MWSVCQRIAGSLYSFIVWSLCLYFRKTACYMVFKSTCVSIVGLSGYGPFIIRFQEYLSICLTGFCPCLRGATDYSASGVSVNMLHGTSASRLSGVSVSMLFGAVADPLLGFKVKLPSSPPLGSLFQYVVRSFGLSVVGSHHLLFGVSITLLAVVFVHPFSGATVTRRQSLLICYQCICHLLESTN